MERIKVYHGTFAEFDRFDESYFGKNTDDNASSEALRQSAYLGFWFNAGGDLQIAYDRILTCHINIGNPLEVESLDQLEYWIESQEKSGKELQEELREEGYDSIIILHDEELGGTSYVVFDPDNIEIFKEG